ncbi:MAG: N-acetyl-gamma-glutamyl-phosphate reductase [Candidatus Latescibacteria bacterium]|nr:N-acetyl-gamma-glutamyl-phosphate reductase [Candidatus Latescibacterota bacterium]
MIKAGIIGATGYTGFELFRLLVKHPQVEVAWATSESYCGKMFSNVYPHLNSVSDLVLKTLPEVQQDQVDVVFCCLPHRTAMSVLPSFLEKQVKVVDLSADFRMATAESYARWYGVEHSCPHLLTEAVYGLPEFNRNLISKASLVANPGCYPTSVILPLAPFLQKGLIQETDIIIDSKSGVSGAGRKLSLRTQFVEINENTVPYDVGRLHRHTGEIEEQLSSLANRQCRVLFAPHIVPMDRGILSTIYVGLKEDISQEQALEIIKDRYKDEPFIRLLPDRLPETRFVQGTNWCDIAVSKVDGTDRLVIISAIDNLMKGASGQAVQNMNIMFGFKETEGLQ